MYEIKIANLHTDSMDINKSILKRNMCVFSHVFNFFRYDIKKL